MPTTTSDVQALQFHSGHGQDSWVITQVLAGKRGGFFVDAGAGADGIESSNSYTLEQQLGWRGICVDANPENCRLIQQNRTSIVEQVALWSEPTEITFTLNLDTPGTCGILSEMNQYNRNLFYPTGVHCQDIAVPAVPLVELLRKHNAPRYIDYLSMDIEGAEYQTLKAFPFDQYTFGCMTIEKASAKLIPLRKLLLSKGYKLVRVKGVDDFWVHPELDYHLPPTEQFAVSARRLVQTIRLSLRGEGE